MTIATARKKTARKTRDDDVRLDRVYPLPVSYLRSCPQNEQLYKPVTRDDPSVQELAESISKDGVREPLVVTLDHYILSGHRRHMAAKIAGLATVPCRYEQVRYLDDDNENEIVRLLREYNRQRVKSRDEVLREEVVSTDPDASYDRLLEYRSKLSNKSGSCVAEIELSERKTRSAISDRKDEMVAAVIRVLKENAEFLPMSLRAVHYNLLNIAPLRNTRNPDSRYANDRQSYGDLSDLLLRMRMDGTVSWDAIIDETRPLTEWLCYPSAQPYFREQLDEFLMGYRRDLQASQPAYIEIIAEKLTIGGIIKPVAMQYMIPYTVGRGYCSIGPRYELAQRFKKSGKDKLALLILSDFDCDGENIAESFARSMRDDFRICNLMPIKVALTAKQVKDLRLPPAMKAKKGSSQYRKFTEQYGDDVFELEAVPAKTLQQFLHNEIRKVVDAEAFNREVDAERDDAGFLESARRRAMRSLEGLEGAA